LSRQSLRIACCSLANHLLPAPASVLIAAGVGARDTSPDRGGGAPPSSNGATSTTSADWPGAIASS
jgi:hypothetical protein